MYKVVITQMTIEERPAGKEWLVVKEAEGENRNVPEYGYTPEIIKKKEVESKIYEQIVETLDIKKVIDAINGPPPLLVDESLIGDVKEVVGKL